MRVIPDESPNVKSDLPPVLFQSSLVESNFYDWRLGNSPNSYLYDPLAAYPMKNRVVPLPLSLTPEVQGHVVGLLETDLRRSNKLILVIHNILWVPWFVERFKEAGLTDRMTQPNDFWILVFERSNKARLIEATY